MASIPSTALWHFRLGHASLPLISKLSSQIPYVSDQKNGICDVRSFAIQRRSNFPISSNKSSNPFDLVHMDIWGSYSVPYIHNHHYFLTVVDNFIRYTWVILLKGKYEVQQCVQNFVILIENQFGCTIKSIRTDNGPEFILPKFYNSKGILHQTSCVSSTKCKGREEAPAHLKCSQSTPFSFSTTKEILDLCNSAGCFHYQQGSHQGS